MRHHVKEVSIKFLLMAASSMSILIVIFIFLFLFKEAFPFLREPGLSALFGSRWVPVSFQQELFGMGPLVSGSVLVTLIATLLALPFGICGAVYIAEIAAPAEREILKPFVELLAAIPSVVLGFFGLMILAPIIKSGFGLNSGLTALTGAVLLALMAIPTIISISEDAIRSVPHSYREASMALGATEIQTVWKVTVPAAKSGIVEIGRAHV